VDITPYKLDDAAFWTGDDRASDPIAMKLVGKHSGVVVDAPRSVSIDERQTLPAGIYHLGAIRQVSTVTFERHGVITVMDSGENRLYATIGRSLIQDSEAMEEPAGDAASLPSGSMATAIPVELRALLGLPWRPSHLLFTALLRDSASNRAAIELRRADWAYKDTEALKREEAARAQRNPPPVFPRNRETSPPAATVPVPADTGIHMAIERIVDRKKAATCPVSGSFRLPALPQEIVKADYHDSGALPGERLPTAVVGITLLVTGADDGSLFVLPMHVASFDRISANETAPIVTGQFTVDLFQFRDMPRQAQTYFVYAFSGEVMTDPVPLALVH